MVIQAESELIDRIQSGDRDAFRYLVAIYKGKAFGLCYSIVRNTEDAKDVLQDSFVKVYKNIESFKKGSSFYTWFYRIIINTSRDFLRKRGRRDIACIDDADDLSSEPANPALTTELRQVLSEAIYELPEKQHLAFVMKHMNGMKIDEIARILHCGPSTVKIHIFRAVRNLRRGLGGYLTDEGYPIRRD